MSYLLPIYYTTSYDKKRKSSKPSKSLREAQRKHKKFLQRLNLPKKYPNTTPIKTEQRINRSEDYKSIHEYDWSPCLRKKRYTTTKTYTIAPAYNKGAYQVISKQHIKDIGK